MKLVIDISDEIYDFVQNTSFVEDESTLFKQTNVERQKTLVLFDIIDTIRNGTPLPEHHGRLIDISEYEKYFNTAITYDDGNHEHVVYTNTIPTIIEGSDSE